jgi:hypothetical protein
MQNFSILTNSHLHREAPSIFTEAGSDKTSEKYAHISTIQVIDALRGEGYYPVYAGQSRSRLPGKKEFAKHCVRFRHADTLANPGTGLFPELVLTNSHDGLSSYKLQAGLYRLVCSNGMIVGETYKQVRVRHQGDIIGNVIEGTFEVMSEGTKVLAAAETMGAIELSQDERIIFGKAVHDLYFDGNESPLVEAIKPDQFLRTRRSADNKQDLFTVFNRAQENVIRGGLSGYHRDPEKGYRKVSTRAINSIDKNNSLNRALWTLAEEMAKLKGAA